MVAASATVTRDLTVPGRLYGGLPAKDIGDTSDWQFARRSTSRNVPRDVADELARARR